MAWKKVSTEMCEILERGLLNIPCEKKQMFGCPAYFINGNWFAGAHQDNIVIRLNQQDRDEIMSAYDEAVLFEPMKDRPMKEFIVMPDQVCHEFKELEQWLTRSHDWVGTWPPKEKKPGKKK